VKYPTNLEKMAAPPLYVAMEKRSPSSVKYWLGLGEEEGVLLYSKSTSTGWWLQPVLKLYVLYRLEPPAGTK